MRTPFLLSLLLWLILLLFLFHGWNHLKPQSTSPSSVPREVLAANKLDFSTFHSARHSHHHHHRHQQHQHGQARHSTVVEVKPSPDGGDEIDPRYGVAKRKVPTGPNPLHH
ncbi:putative CLAVATA3/ESR (CLE)-related protein 13 [Cocos nucifera]|uniref:Putative CLAVATA3/ESR (CLE)-related protein 13 n=1 Tax=Cocos nucifera TaxID=13894 RepID=A0A8K0HXY3_COCNU|nr:putative CLAVATA3/ESR (CLE)-related protein 13 [Cocos nucifera]